MEVVINKEYLSELYGFMPSHPGLLLKDEIEYRDLSQNRLAEEMQIPYAELDEILNAEKPLTPAVALMFEATLGVDPDTLMRMQTRYNMHIARNDSGLLSKLKLLRSVAAL